MITSRNADETDGDPTLPPGTARRSPRITREQVFAAAWELATEGHRPTIERVRMRLGDGVPRGSPNTVNAWLNEWWTQLALRLRDKPGAAIPTLPERVSGALEALWTEALAAARGAQQAALADREQQLAVRERAVEEHTAQVAEQEEVVAGRAAALEEAHALGREQLLAANRRTESLEASERDRAAEIVTLREQISTRDNDIRRLQAHLESERERLNRRYDVAETRWLTEVDQARQALKEQAQELKRLSSDHRAIRQNRDRIQRDLARTQSNLVAALSQRDRLAAELRRPRPPASKSKPARRTKSSKRRSS